MKLIALRDLSYDRQRIAAGNAFEADGRFAKVLKAAGRAADYVDTTVKAPVAPILVLSPPEPPPNLELSLPVSGPETAATEEQPMLDVSLTPVEPMTTKDNGALVPTRRGVYRRRDIEPGQTVVMTPERGGAPDDGAAV